MTGKQSGKQRQQTDKDDDNYLLSAVCCLARFGWFIFIIITCGTFSTSEDGYLRRRISLYGL